MNSEAKPFASLSSGLLARKGAARPAMRPQGFGQAGAGLEDLGWNDMGFEQPKPAEVPVLDADHDGFGEVVPAHPHNLAGLTPVDSPVHNQQAEIAGRLSTYAPDDSGEDEIDETAELYEPEADVEVEDAGAPVVKAELAPVVKAELAPVVKAELAPVVKAETAPVAKVVPAPVVEAERVPVAKVVPAPVARRPRKPRAAPGSKDKAAFTLRLDPDRHLKLRLACALGGRSAQLLVTQALDDLLASMPELDAMAEKAKRKG